jgi:hypothetical protein
MHFSPFCSVAISPSIFSLSNNRIRHITFLQSCTIHIILHLIYGQSLVTATEKVIYLFISILSGNRDPYLGMWKLERVILTVITGLCLESVARKGVGIL